MKYTVQISWDPEAALWTATSKEIIGLAVEDASLDSLTEQVRSAVPALLEYNQQEQCCDLVFIYDGPNCR